MNNILHKSDWRTTMVWLAKQSVEPISTQRAVPFYSKKYLAGWCWHLVPYAALSCWMHSEAPNPLGDRVRLPRQQSGPGWLCLRLCPAPPLSFLREEEERVSYFHCQDTQEHGDNTKQKNIQPSAIFPGKCSGVWICCGSGLITDILNYSADFFLGPVLRFSGSFTWIVSILVTCRIDFSSSETPIFSLLSNSVLLVILFINISYCGPHKTTLTPGLGNKAHIKVFPRESKLKPLCHLL